MSRRIAAALIAAALLGAGLQAWAGPERVEFPVGYQQTFLRFGEVDRPDRKPQQVRFFYVDPKSAAAATAEQPVPDGAVLIMEDRRARLDANGAPLRDAQGRFIASDEVVNVFVQEKRVGWGEAYPAATRNGDWEYAVFEPDGRRRNANTAGCFACHLPRAPTDFTFIFKRWVIDGKPGP